MRMTILAAALALALPAAAQSPADHILLTVVLKHDQSKNLDAIGKEARAQGFYENFPPKGIEVASWVVAMGLGQVVTLKVPPARLREVNRAIETGAWGPFRTEIYASYDFMPVAKTLHAPLR